MISWQMGLDIIMQTRRVMRFTFGKDVRTRSWLYKKLMTIKLATCSLLKRDAECLKKNNFSLVLFFAATKQLEEKITIENVFCLQKLFFRQKAVLFCGLTVICCYFKCKQTRVIKTRQRGARTPCLLRRLLCACCSRAE